MWNTGSQIATWNLKERGGSISDKGGWWGKVNVKQSHYRPWGFQEVEAPRFFKTIVTWRWQGCQPYAPAAFTPGNIPGNHFCWRLRRPQGHSATGRIMSMKKSSDMGVGEVHRQIVNRVSSLGTWGAFLGVKAAGTWSRPLLNKVPGLRMGGAVRLHRH
jgi:hypothetical protein